MTSDKMICNDPSVIKALKYLNSYCHNNSCGECELLGLCQILWSGEFEHLYGVIEKFLDE